MLQSWHLDRDGGGFSPWKFQDAAANWNWRDAPLIWQLEPPWNVEFQLLSAPGRADPSWAVGAAHPVTMTAPISCLTAELLGRARDYFPLFWHLQTPRNPWEDKSGVTCLGRDANLSLCLLQKYSSCWCNKRKWVGARRIFHLQLPDSGCFIPGCLQGAGKWQLHAVLHQQSLKCHFLFIKHSGISPPAQLSGRKTLPRFQGLKEDLGYSIPPKEELEEILEMTFLCSRSNRQNTYKGINVGI